MPQTTTRFRRVAESFVPWTPYLNTSDSLGTSFTAHVVLVCLTGSKRAAQAERQPQYHSRIQSEIGACGSALREENYNGPR